MASIFLSWSTARPIDTPPPVIGNATPRGGMPHIRSQARRGRRWLVNIVLLMVAMIGVSGGPAGEESLGQYYRSYPASQQKYYRQPNSNYYQQSNRRNGNGWNGNQYRNPNAGGPTPATNRNYANERSLFAIRENEQTAASESAPTPHRPFPRLAADFEPQRGLVISVSDWQVQHANVLQQLVAATAGHVPLLILANDRDQVIRAMEWLTPIDDQSGHVHFALLPLNTIWLRDFAPLLAELEDGSCQSVDFFYAGERPKDDAMPKAWADRTGSRYHPVRFTLQGGNLISNGQHLGVATERIFVDNAITFPNPVAGVDPIYEGRKIVFDALLKHCNLKEFIILEHLQSEATKHVDMFASFLSADQIVVSEVDARQDPINAAILDRNANRLSKVEVDGQPLQVHRIRIPTRDGASWSAFTNIIIANDLLLMPIFESDSRTLVAEAVATYQKLLPKHTIKTLDITSFKKLQGELHCLSMNLPKFAAWPNETNTYQQIKQAIAVQKQR